MNNKSDFHFKRQFSKPTVGFDNVYTKQTERRKPGANTRLAQLPVNL